MAFGLGKGLESLIPDKKPVRKTPVSSGMGLQEIAISLIVANPYQPRRHFSVERLEELSASIKQYGLLEPLIVSPGKKAGTYVLVAGERRLRAAEMAGLEKVPVTVRDTGDQEKLEIALVENIQRQDLNPLEEAKALRKLLREFKLGQAEVAKRIGRSRSAVANCLRLLDLHADVQQALLEDRITAGHARALLACKNQQIQIELLALIEGQHLSVRQTERLANKSKHASVVAKSTQRIEPPDATFARVGRQLSSHFGAKVQLVDAPNGGRIVIEYYSEEERNRIVDKILGKKQIKLPDIQDFTV